jgi:hypothetical protein
MSVLPEVRSRKIFNGSGVLPFGAVKAGLELWKLWIVTFMRWCEDRMWPSVRPLLRSQYLKAVSASDCLRISTPSLKTVIHLDFLLHHKRYFRTCAMITHTVLSAGNPVSDFENVSQWHMTIGSAERTFTVQGLVLDFARFVYIEFSYVSHVWRRTQSTR